MSVKHAILVLLYNQPRYGYEIKVKFEEMVHNLWPLNAGQIYSTIDRLVRDELVAVLDEKGDRKKYYITEKGKKELTAWLLEPVVRSFLKDSFFFKLLCSNEINFSMEKQMIQQQKTYILQHILQLSTLRRKLNPERHKFMIQLIEAEIFHLEADLKWLDLIQDQETDNEK